jgi:hypothetical protein
MDGDEGGIHYSKWAGIWWWSGSGYVGRDFTRLGPDGANLIIRKGPAVETTDVGEAAFAACNSWSGARLKDQSGQYIWVEGKLYEDGGIPRWVSGLLCSLTHAADTGGRGEERNSRGDQGDRTGQGRARQGVE